MGFYVDNNKQGLWESWRRNGKFVEKGHYNRGKKQGSWEFFNWNDGSHPIQKCINIYIYHYCIINYSVHDNYYYILQVKLVIIIVTKNTGRDYKHYYMCT